MNHKHPIVLIVENDHIRVIGHGTARYPVQVEIKSSKEMSTWSAAHYDLPLTKADKELLKDPKISYYFRVYYDVEELFNEYDYSNQLQKLDFFNTISYNEWVEPVHFKDHSCDNEENAPKTNKFHEVTCRRCRRLNELY